MFKKQLEENPLLELEEDDSQPELPEAEPDWAEYFRDTSDLGFVPRTNFSRKGLPGTISSAVNRHWPNTCWLIGDWWPEPRKRDKWASLLSAVWTDMAICA